MKEVIVIICCDTEPDQPQYGGLDYNVHFGKHTWKGIKEGIPKAKEVANYIEDAEGHNAKITWFLRSDDQIKELYGDPAWMVRNFMGIWKELGSQGDEIGWHPHLWRWNESIKSWYPELEDRIWIENCMEEGYNRFPEEFKLTSSRMCWNFHSNITMNKVDELGLKVDISAMPGQKSIKPVNDSPDSLYYDWEITKEPPYFPSQSDYRREADINERSLDILEIPLTNFEISLSWQIKRILKRFLRPGRGYPLGKRNPAKIDDNPDFFRSCAIRKFFESKENNCRTFLVSYFHADELPGKDSLASTYFERNLKYISEASRNYGVPFRFLTAREAAGEVIK
ncbi:MAG: hypothetical protein OIN84_08985 [Candidatus Methanoperedens sp.]|uniref:hypothetical protein n=1 Tax=Candidatus Methanoperedens sp. BLZ2 TaxID=2035255 RepID=UPI000BE3C6C1|nr:hypothetical protein [Candidatus Methanoperedens sp. BLZ2]KAB2946163.1 MAG: hypothetical protein F9K14_08475 [Candidatus Methanoperedens sp.]MBZ0177606.1 hypothetical protein [Candidatus Methanoperedens nitroreducens]MCX9078096.1 hypothetical protein [Candidatus Methanoperedens sp.]